MKIVTGSDGMNVKKVARAIRQLGRVPELSEAYNLAMGLGFGSARTLVVMGVKRSKFETGDKRLSQLYRLTFNNSRFNPRWSYSTADYITVVDL